ncbi:hypothetical protein CR513_14279, partial [Mucuna pruriens]
MVLPLSKEAVAPFILHGEYLKKIRQAWKKIVKKGPEWGLRSCRALSSYKSWLQHKVESILLYVRQTSEKGLRELEWNQASLEKEELIVALADAKSKEDVATDHLCQL